MKFGWVYATMGLQRLRELQVGKKHLAQVQGQLFEKPPRSDRREMMALHSAWFAASAVEHLLRGRRTSRSFGVGVLILALAQALRYRSIAELRDSWTQIPIAYRGQHVARTGPYRYVRHPIYLAVIAEIAVMPLLGGAWITSVVFSALNALFLKQRIALEEEALGHLPEYRVYAAKTGQLIPRMLY